MDTEVMDLIVLEGKVFDVIGINDARIAQAAEKFMPLTIKNLDDKAGYAAVHEGRMVVRNMRIIVEKHAKKVRGKAVKFQRDVIAEEKRVISLIQPIEDHLTDEENRVDEEKTRIKAEADAKEAARIQARINILFKMGCKFDGTNFSYASLVAPQALVKVCTDEQFTIFTTNIQKAINEETAVRAAEMERIAQVTTAQEAERIRLAKESARIKAEQDRITAEQTQERQRLAAEAKSIQNEKDRLANEKKAAEDAKKAEEQAKLRAEELVKAQEEAAEKAARETEERIKREQAEKVIREEKARIAAEHKAARAPDKEKIIKWIATFNETNNPTPIVKSTEAGKIIHKLRTDLKTLLQSAQEAIESL